MSDARLVAAFPPTLVIRSPHENPKKCSILPLRGRADLRFLSYPTNETPGLENYVCLAAEGPPLTSDDRDRGLLLLDASWRRAAVMRQAFAHVPARSLTGFHTAYPRVSKRGTDPDQGLATVEALYIAYHLLGRATAGLLDHYRWRNEFLRLNEWESSGTS
jgi:pre-rRNA-processing protein TSR3